jgi:NitT/TauT family transport system permease protein
MTRPARSLAARSLAGRLLWLAPILALGCGWEAVAALGAIDVALFPPPSAIWRELRLNDFSVGIGYEQTSIAETIAASLGRVFAGLVIAFASAFALAVVLAAWRPGRWLIEPLIQLLAPIAPVAWVPFGLALFGTGNGAAVFLVFLGVIFVLTLGMAAAIRGVPREFLQIAETFGATRWKTWTMVIVPAVLPRAFLLLRMNFFGGWMAVLSAEMVGLRSGLGALIMVGRESANMQIVILGMALIGLTGAAFDFTLGLVQKRFLWWVEAEPWR